LLVDQLFTFGGNDKTLIKLCLYTTRCPAWAVALLPRLHINMR